MYYQKLKKVQFLEVAPLMVEIPTEWSKEMQKYSSFQTILKRGEFSKNPIFYLTVIYHNFDIIFPIFSHSEKACQLQLAKS